MVDPLKLIGNSAGLMRASPGTPGTPGAGGPGAAGGPSFKQTLLDNLQRVNEMQNDANRAIEDLQTGARDDVETVLMATQKADSAFRMLLALRNKVMDAYTEIKDVRV